jgi:hypothetical protein
MPSSSASQPKNAPPQSPPPNPQQQAREASKNPLKDLPKEQIPKKGIPLVQTGFGVNGKPGVPPHPVPTTKLENTPHSSGGGTSTGSGNGSGGGGTGDKKSVGGSSSGSGLPDWKWIAIGAAIGGGAVYMFYNQKKTEDKNFTKVLFEIIIF